MYDVRFVKGEGEEFSEIQVAIEREDGHRVCEHLGQDVYTAIHKLAEDQGGGDDMLEHYCALFMKGFFDFFTKKQDGKISEGVFATFGKLLKHIGVMFENDVSAEDLLVGVLKDAKIGGKDGIELLKEHFGEERVQSVLDKYDIESKLGDGKDSGDEGGDKVKRTIDKIKNLGKNN